MNNSKIFFLTRSLDPLTIFQNNINTSSKKFELGFIKELNTKSDLEVIYIGKEDEIDEIDEIDEKICYKCINHYSILGIIILLHRVTKSSNKKNIIITSSYYPLLSFILVISKLLGTSVFSYVYDTHLLSTENMKKVKKIFVNVYFLIGFSLAKRFTGFLVLNDIFLKKNKIKIPYLKTKIGISFSKNKKDNLSKKINTKKKKKIICFAGTFNKENGVEILLNAFKQNRNINIELHFYGYGDLEQEILTLVNKDERIKFFGSVSQDILQNKLLEADYLINLRDPMAITSDYAFPSKFIDFLATGIPVISNIFPALDKIYIPYIIPVDYFSVASVIDSLILLDKTDFLDIKNEKVIKLLNINNNWSTIVDEIITFIHRDFK